MVHVVRHGEVYNPDRIFYGRLPGYRLSGYGIDQAATTARYLAEEGGDIGYLAASPLERAQQTAEPIARALDLAVVEDRRLIEPTNGFEGQRAAGGGKILLAPKNWPLMWNPLRPSWGEPYQAIVDRVLAAVTAAVAAANGRNAVCVTHQLPVVALRRHALGQHLWHDPRKRNCALASVTTFAVEGSTVTYVGYAEPAGATPRDAVAGA